jgi:hypothetical protein
MWITDPISTANLWGEFRKLLAKAETPIHQKVLNLLTQFESNEAEFEMESFIQWIPFIAEHGMELRLSRLCFFF